MINPTTYENMSAYLEESSEVVVYEVGAALVILINDVIKDPGNLSRAKNKYDKTINEIVLKFRNNSGKWVNDEISKAYILGIKSADFEIKSIGGNLKSSNEIINGAALIKAPPPITPIPEIPGQILLNFKGYSAHTEFFGVFRGAAYYSLEDKPLQIMRKANDIYRKIAVEVGEQSFKEGNIITRRQLSQKLLDEYAKRGLQCITYKDGRVFSIDSYCEMLGRTLTGRCALQASINRYVEKGYNLGIVSAHFRACDLCTPFEGTILSMDGQDKRYPSIWDAETQGLFHPNSFDCVTEVYTNNGWKLFKNVKNKDKIFSLNPENHIPEWVEFKRKFEYNPGNEMIEFKSNSFDLLVTKNHNMYIGVNSHAANKERITKWKMEKAENCLSKNFKQLRCVNWKGKNINFNTFGYTKKEFAFLLGIYMAKGHVEKNRNNKIGRIVITQYKINGIKEIEKILKPMGFYFSGNRFIKDNVKLAQYLKQFGKSFEKYIPNYILNEKPGIIKEFLYAFLIGDGTIRKQKSKLKNIESIKKIYFTSSDKLAAQIGECIIKIGKYPSFNLQKSKGKLQKHKNGEYICNFNIWRIAENNSKTSYHNISKSNNHRGIQSKIIDNYNGLAYCLELEKNHIMLIRRNGKISWCMNCKHDISPFFEGLTQPLEIMVGKAEQALIDKYGYRDAQIIAYKAQQKQRYIERKIRQYKRRESVALDKISKKKARNKILFWQKAQRNHLKENTFLPRKYSREQIKRAY